MSVTLEHTSAMSTLQEEEEGRRNEMDDLNSDATSPDNEIILNDFHRWIDSLTYDDLLDALTFPLNGCNINHSSTNPTIEKSTSSNEGNHEYELLRQMFAMQSPPPTPIHPRALTCPNPNTSISSSSTPHHNKHKKKSKNRRANTTTTSSAKNHNATSSSTAFHPASLHGLTDGKNNQDRIRKNRFTRPRLFQWIPDYSTAVDHNPSSQDGMFQSNDGASISSDDNNNSIGIGGDDIENSLNGLGAINFTGMPPEIVAMIKQEEKARIKKRSSSKSNILSPSSPKKQNHNNNNQHHHNSGRKNISYQVLAKSFSSPWGDALSLACTEDQRQADNAILFRVRLQYGCRYVQHDVSSDSISNSDTVNGDNSKSSRHSCTTTVLDLDSTIPVLKICDERHNYHEIMSKKSNVKSKDELLRMIHIASRGKFLSKVIQTISTSNSTKQHYHDNHYSHFCAPWFHPTEEWFSLPMYIVSRLEVALWNSFHRYTNRHTIWILPKTRIEDAMPEMSLSEISSTMSQAVCHAFKEKVMSDSSCLSCGKVRDLLFHSVLCSSTCTMKSPFFGLLSSNMTHAKTQNIDDIMKSITSIPLVEFESSQDKLRLIIIQYLEESLSSLAEKKLLQSIASSPKSTTRNGIGHQSSTTVKQSTRASKKKKKKKKKKGSMGSSTLKSSSLRVIDEHRMETTTSHINKDDNGILSTLDTAGSINIPTNSFLSDDQGTKSLPSEERNQNIIMALSILNDVMNDTFKKLNFQSTDDNNEERHQYHKVQRHPRTDKEKRNENIQVRLNKGLGKPRLDTTTQAQTSYSNRAPRTEQSPINMLLEHKDTIMNAKPSIDYIAENQLTIKRNNLAQGGNGPSLSEYWDRAISPPVLPFYQQGRDEAISPVSARFDQYHEENDFSTSPATRSDLEDRTLFYYNDQQSRIPTSGSEYQESSSLFNSKTPQFPSLQTFLWNQNQRERSLLADFFDEQPPLDTEIVSSTAASIASSILDDNDGSDTSHRSTSNQSEVESHIDPPQSEETVTPSTHSLIERKDVISNIAAKEDSLSLEEQVEDGMEIDKKTDESQDNLSISTGRSTTEANVPFKEDIDQSSVNTYNTPKPPTSDEPSTPPPQRSPILVSLADLGKLRKQTEHFQHKHSLDIEQCKSEEKTPSAPQRASGSSLPASPKTAKMSRVSSLDDCNVVKRGHSGSRSTIDTFLSYRNAAMKSLPSRQVSTTSISFNNTSDVNRKKEAGSRFGRSAFSVNNPKELKEVIIDGYINLNTCAQSESALDAHEDSSHWNIVPRDVNGGDNATITKDGATTISSHPVPFDSEEMFLLREERNGYRDMCLTLGGEIAKLNNILALSRHHASSNMNWITNPSPTYSHGAEHISHLQNNRSSYDPEFMPPFFQHDQKGPTRRFVAMSDVGLGTYHENYHPPSEDGTDAMQESVAATDTSCNHHPRTASSSRISSMCGPRPGSDVASLEHGTVAYSAVNTNHSHSHSRLHCREIIGSDHYHGLCSRLTNDIDNFVSAVSAKLKRQEKSRKLATKRLTALVTTLWPRAKVEMYGSFVSNLCLPSSDLDFVICLPEVHKETFADTPGALEGRNAINESNQKLLARKLKSESWIETRSIKIIERTVVPVIKLSTKDTRARSIQLDISFDSGDHQGLEAVKMVTGVMEKHAAVRPLVLILKQFMIDRGLLTAYTGGLSSYCLFLMVTKFLQEQTMIWVDTGSLLMGFLDFYGNFFDPRTTGISVGRHQYFSRLYDTTIPSDSHIEQQQQQMFSQNHQCCPPGIPNAPVPQSGRGLHRRHSFGKHGQITDLRGHPSCRPPLFSSLHQRQHFDPKINTTTEEVGEGIGHPSFDPMVMPFTFDPFYVEDPISSGNNVGRNSFRIYQVKRAFSDAHASILASLEWDMNSPDLNEGHYPLLKCLLQNEHAFCE